MRKWILSEINYGYVKNHSYEVAVLPIGATEPHNLHLPYGTDLFEATILGEKICQAAHENGARPVLLPTIPYGTETNMHALPLAMNLNPSTLTQVTTDLVASLVDSNIRKVVLLNSHGGNGLKPLLRELYDKTEARLFLCNWFEVLADIYDEIFSEKEDHAGEMETSFGMAFFPELVIRNEDGSLAADEGATRESRFEAINRGWVSITRPWQLLTTNSGSGNPHAATKEKGEQMMQHLVERLGTFLVELSAAEIDDHFPFKP